MREYINGTFGSPGTEASPLNQTASAGVVTLLKKACRDMAGSPLNVSMTRPLVIEKLYLYTYDNASGVTESEPYVFVFQR